MSTWLQESDVLAWLGLDQTGPVLNGCINAAEREVQGWRLADKPQDWSVVSQTHPHVYQAAVQLASLTYKQSTTVEGFSGFDSAGGIILPDNSQMVRIRHMARANAPGVG